MSELVDDIFPESNLNALVIAYYFPPMGLSGVQRTLKFVKYLPDFGWNPVVLTTENSDYYAYDDTLLEEIPDIVKIFKVPESKRKSKIKSKPRKFPNYFKQRIGAAIVRFFKQPDSKIHWKKFALKEAEKIIQEHDIKIIFATAPPFTSFLIAKELSEKYDIPFVIDYRDNWVDNPFHFYPTLWHKNYNIELEKSVLTVSERAFVITRYAKELLLKRYRFLSHDDVVILPHGYDPEDFVNIPATINTRKLVFTHSGLFQDDRTPKYFLKAINLFLKDYPDATDEIELRFVGLMRPSHTRLIKRYKVANICTLTGYLNHKEAVQNLIESNVLWLTVNDTIRTPGKLYEYIGAMKPILYLGPQGQISSIVKDTKAGFIVDNKKVKEISSVVKKIYLLWKDSNLPEPDKDNADNYNRKHITAQLARQLSLHSKM
ncbi:MAG: glycosyltransferase [Candidatus Kapabacteria bacterium]|nr:glycosyltransferase [Ignavibacteriota bacterium]MCW5884117.1 glycosyltransferase [Candidatus Kapabacteria bacterium]